MVCATAKHADGALWPEACLSLIVYRKAILPCRLSLQKAMYMRAEGLSGGRTITRILSRAESRRWEGHIEPGIRQPVIFSGKSAIQIGHQGSGQNFYFTE